MKFNKVLIALYLLISIIASAHAEIKGTDFTDNDDTSICSWFDLVTVPEIIINEAKKRKITCGGNYRLIPRNAQPSGDTWKCRYGYQEKGWSCVEKLKIPKNAHKNKDGTGWTCDRNYYRDSTRKHCLIVPENANSPHDSNYRSCNPRYYKNLSRSSCLAVPLNATKSSDYGFNCN